MNQKDGFSLGEIEQGAVSALMQWPDEAFREIARYKIGAEHFANPVNRSLFERVSALFKEGKPLDLVAFTALLRDEGVLEKHGGAFYLTQTWCNVCHSPMVMAYYCELLVEASAKRKLIETCADALETATVPGTEGIELVKDTIAELGDIPVGLLFGASPTLTEAAFAKMEAMEKGAPESDVVATGIEKLDQASPLRNGDMVLITGARKVGKSMLALSIAANVARRGLSVLYFSLEDRMNKLADRLFAGVTRIPMALDHVSKLSAAQQAKCSTVPLEFARWNFAIKDDVFDIEQIAAVALEEKKRTMTSLIVVDYAQLIRAAVPSKREQNREQEVASVSRRLRLVAMELATPLILLCQLNAEGATRESRSLEQDATACWNLRDDEDEPQKRWIEIPFQRNGRSGVKFPVTFLGEIARIENYAEGD